MIDLTRRRTTRALRAPRKIAIVRALQLGDLLLAVPALRAVRARYPHTEITLIGLPWAAAFARRFSHYLDRFVVFPGFPGIAEADVEPERTARFIREQRAYGYDLVVQMHGSGRVSNRFALALGGAATVGYYEPNTTSGLTVGAPYPGDEPEIVRNLELARLLGCRCRNVTLEFPLTHDDVGEASALLGDATSHQPLIALHPGARAPARRWPAGYFAEVGDILAERYGTRVVITGGQDEVTSAAHVRECMRRAPVDLAGKTSLGGLAAIIRRADLFISNDTGPAHLADAMGTPSITLFGPADPARWAPLDRSLHPVVRRPVTCSPCPHWECPIDHRCLRRLTPDTVVAVAGLLLAKGIAACNAQGF